MPQGISLGAGDPGLALGQSIKIFFTKLPGLSESASLSPGTVPGG